MSKRNRTESKSFTTNTEHHPIPKKPKTDTDELVETLQKTTIHSPARSPLKVVLPSLEEIPETQPTLEEIAQTPFEPEAHLTRTMMSLMKMSCSNLRRPLF